MSISPSVPRPCAAAKLLDERVAQAAEQPPAGDRVAAGRGGQAQVGRGRSAGADVGHGKRAAAARQVGELRDDFRRPRSRPKTLLGWRR